MDEQSASEGANPMAATDVTAEIHGFSEPNAKPAPWTAALEQLRSAETYWLSTVRPGGRPHVTPLIAVWHADALWFATGPDEIKARNLAANPHCVLTTGRSDLAEGGFDIVLEGQAELVSDEAELEPVATAYALKYPDGPWDFVVRDGAFSDRDAGGRVIVFRLQAARGLGFRKGDHYSQTTWRFPR
jgi:general stress protein 26